MQNILSDRWNNNIPIMTLLKYYIFQGQGVQVLYVQEEFQARGGHRRQFRLHRWRCKCELYKSNTVTRINNH